MRRTNLAQTGTDWKTEGNTADSSSFIGTTNPSCLQFRSNNIERMRISHDGNVGIGVDNPEERLDVDGDFQLHGDIIFTDYEDSQNSSLRILMIDSEGRTTKMSKSLFKAYSSWEDCFDINVGVTLPGQTGPVTVVAGTYSDWGKRIEGSKSILYTGSDCPAWVGIGTNLPMTKLDVRGDGRFLHGVNVGEEYTVNAGLYIENFLAHSDSYFDYLIMVKDENGDKLLQLNNDGLLRAREIKVDLEAWPDYVFEKEYQLMSLNEVKTFIEENGHLPNVPSAQEIEVDGVNLGDAAKTSMEKIEELTLYLIEINDKVEKQEATLEEQSKLLEEQQETIRLQQELIEALKKLSNKN
ncbi:hypothetical protein [Brumimicrobium aurantiacum]|uniref:Peptidase S74 domain-containing protein n=1 Tax=Brumimicrobium aurantiacum TaxID=1737063 RepID=A0A3E1EVQ5_9FLAO|nr:hypothetical protein [Brumimicrobium aurantiacum]RFC53639.1 hypothetical protein DXU93_12830 [Brumimicrobium aurantiacum]